MNKNTSRIVLKITIAFVAIVILFMHTACEPKVEIEKVAAITNRAAMPRLHTTNITTVISDSGITRYRIIAPVWDYYDKSDQPYWDFPMGVRFEQFDENLKVYANLQSKYARFNQFQKLWILKGDVRMTNVKGELFESERLYWDQNLERIYSDTIVKITQATSIIHAVGFESNQQMTKYLFKSTTGIFPVDDN